MRGLPRTRTDLIEARSPTHMTCVAPVGFVGPCSSTPPCRLPRRPLHFHGRILKVPSIVRGECNVIHGIVGNRWLKTRRLRRTALWPKCRLLWVRAWHRFRTHLIEAHSMTHSSRTASIGFVGPWTSPPSPPSSPPPTLPWANSQGLWHSNR